MHETPPVRPLWNIAAMGLREPQGSIPCDIELLSARHRLVESGRGLLVQVVGFDDGGRVLEAATVDLAAGAVDGGWLVDVEGLVGGVDLAVVDGGGGADGH